MPSNERFYYSTKYGVSHALVIGIDRYKVASPLGYAVSDAIAIRDLLVSRFGFDLNDVTLITDDGATKLAILQALSRLSKVTELDDRVLVFYAGHGHTLQGNRGDVGFLVPYEGDPDDFSSLLAWKDMVDAMQFVRAKHALFIMDACYSGLALTRKTHAGSTRFLKDMLLRRSRQVLTAGKADEVVADSGGPVPNHSVFTGHLIQGLEGAAADVNGVITGSGLLAYVYAKVGADLGSEQTPHYGHVDGDGDFIFAAPNLSDLNTDGAVEQDILLSIPFADDLIPRDAFAAKVGKTKQILANREGSIELHDLLMGEVRHFLSSTAEDSFGMADPLDVERLLERLDKYEQASKRMAVSLACVAYWGEAQHLSSLRKCLARATDRLGQASGNSVWLALRWYPIILTIYCAGIAAVDAGRFDNLYAVFSVSIERDDLKGMVPLGYAVGDAISEFYQYDVFKRLPGHERNHVPPSEYLFKLLQPMLDDAFYMGKGYESSFDIFEIISSLFFIDVRLQRGEHPWGPPGRFSWKARSHHSGPAARLLAEARAQQNAWPLLQSGFFGGSFERFENAAKEMEQGFRYPMM